MPRLASMIALCCFALPSSAADNGSQFTVWADVELGKLTLAEMAERLGPAELVESGDAGEYEARICYRTPSGLVHFLSGEMGGSSHQLLGFAFSGDNAALRCGELPASYRPVSLDLDGLRLGLTKAEFAHVAGTNVRWDANVGRVSIESRRPMTPSDLADFPKIIREDVAAGKVQNYFDVVVSITATFSDEQLSEFSVWKIETF